MLKNDLTDSEKKLADVDAQVKAKEEELKKTTDDFSAYKKKMKPYEALSSAEAEAKKAEAAAAKAAEEAAGFETGITYDQLARTPDDYIGKKVKFRGKVVQVIESSASDTVQVRLAVDSNYDTILLAEYDKSVASSRILDDDMITIYGLSTGVISYESTMGGTITIPGILVSKIDQ